MGSWKKFTRRLRTKKGRQQLTKKSIAQSTGAVGASLGDPYAGSNTKDLLNGSRSTAASRLLDQV